MPRKKPKKYHVGFVDEEGMPSKPTERQQEAWNQLMEPGVVVQLALGGTRGAKTSYGVWAMLQIAMANPGIAILFGHDNIKDLKSSVLFHLGRMCPEHFTPDPTDEEPKPKKIVCWETSFSEQKIIIRHPEPKYNHKVFGYMCVIHHRPLNISKGLSEKLQRSGIQIGAALVDQVDLLGPETLDAVLTRLSGRVRKVIMTANPPRDDIPAWYEDTFITEKRKDTPGWENRRFIIMNPGDNPHIPLDYIKNLEDNLPEEKALRMVKGIRNTGTGIIFDNFKDEHFIDFEGPVPPDSAIIEVLDWGFVDPALCVWWVRFASGKWMRHGSIKRQGMSPIDFAKLCLERRKAILYDGGRKRGNRIPQFLGTPADPGMFEVGKDGGKSVPDQMASYMSPDGMRFIPQRISRVRGGAHSLKNAQIARTKDMISRDLILINRLGENYDQFIDQIHQYKWKETKDDVEPYEPKVKGGFERGIIHHFEEAVCFRYFGWHVNPDAKIANLKAQEILNNPERWGNPKGAPTRPRHFQKFERRMRNM